jgi:GTP-binding protein EngB required for normal cell division
MAIRRKLRIFIAIAVLLITVFLLLFVFLATKTAISLWHELQQLPEWLFYTYIGIIGLVIASSLYIVIRLLLPTKETVKTAELPTEATVEESLEQAESTGLDTTDIRAELDALQARKAAGKIYVSFFGDISTGKSSLIKTLIPEADTQPHIRGGSTRDVSEYIWELSSGDQLILVDLPGRNEVEGSWEDMAKDEAIRSQVVVYVTDIDLTRSQFDDITLLQSFGKPLLLTINKSDRYTPDEKEQLKRHILQFFDQAPELIFTSAGGQEEVVRIFPDGREETVMRERKADIQQLTHALQNTIDDQYDTLNQLRDASVLVLTQQKLDEAKLAFRQEKGKEIIQQSTKKAVLGAMAAVSPGTDLVIQGVLGTRMIQQLCKLYNVPVKQLDIDRFLDFSQEQVKKSIPLLLAVVGNGFKAFPGIGTLAGGMIHAVAYGIIFDTLGKAVLHTLETRGHLKAAPAAMNFKEMLSENLESRAKTLAKLVLEERQSNSK